MRRLPLDLALLVLTSSLIGCSAPLASESNTTQEQCAPQTYHPIDDDILAAHALVLCIDPTPIESPDIIASSDLVLMPAGGTHTFYIRTHPGWEIPEPLPEGAMTVFAGACSIDLSCLPEFDKDLKWIESNRQTVTFRRLDANTLRLDYTLPEQPRQVYVKLDYCAMWNQFCPTMDDPMHLTPGRWYVFRYESVAHIGAADQPADAQCKCPKQGARFNRPTFRAATLGLWQHAGRPTVDAIAQPAGMFSRIGATARCGPIQQGIRNVE